MSAAPEETITECSNVTMNKRHHRSFVHWFIHSSFVIRISSLIVLLCVVPRVAAASPYASDAWLAQFPRDADGYTNFPTADPVYVGNQPGDAPDLKSAQQMCRSRHTRCILFRRGQVYSAAQINDVVQINGLSAADPFVVGATADVQNPRPILQKILGVGNPHQPTQFIVIFGLDFYDPTADPANPAFDSSQHRSKWADAIRMVDSVTGGTHIWIEDCRVRDLLCGFELQENASGAPFTTAILRRCVVDHCYGSRCGVYTFRIADLLIDQGVYDHNGWMENIRLKDIFSHDMYLQEWPAGDDTDPQTRVRDAIIARAASTGCQQRSGGINDGCCFIGNPIAGFVGDKAGSVIRNAVICGGGFDLSIGKSNPRGWGAQLNFCPQGTLENIICTDKQDPRNAGWAFQVQCINSRTKQNVPTNATLRNLIVTPTWSGAGISIVGTTGSITYDNCDLPGQPPGPGIIATPTYPDPGRTVASYARSLGLSGVSDADSFLAAAARNCRGNYNPALTATAVNAYIRAGFAR
jgi:hypothetical protein